VVTAAGPHASVDIKVEEQPELKVRPGFGAVTMKNVAKTKYVEKDRSCRPTQFKSPEV